MPSLVEESVEILAPEAEAAPVAPTRLYARTSSRAYNLVGATSACRARSQTPRKLRELRADLRRAGFAIAHQTGSHQVWKRPRLPGTSAVLAGSDGADAKPYQETQVRRLLATLREMEERQQP